MSRMFGTDGVRGIANNELTPELAFKLGRAGAFVLTGGAHKPKILVAKDTRVSGDMLENALIAGILSVGAEAVKLGVIPTPAVAYLTRELNADAGVMISASHNPVEYNGIKFFNNKGYKLSDSLEDEIQSIIENDFKNVPSPIGDELGRTYAQETALIQYIDYAVGTINTDLSGMRIALDCANGACYKAAVKAFRELGARVYVINDNPDGFNINEKCGSTHMNELQEYVKRKQCDIGFAFDGDADRCLAVDENGNIVHGDFILAICAKALKDEGKLTNNTLVATVMSNLGLDIACKKEGINLLKTKVGDRYVLEEMVKDSHILGGEQSGHIIFLNHNTTGDGLVTALQIAAILKKSQKKFSELTSIMTELPQVLLNLTVPNDKKDIYKTDSELISLIKETEDKLNGRGRVLIRPSGTEPLIRVMIEGENKEEINIMASNIINAIKNKI